MHEVYIFRSVIIVIDCTGEWVVFIRLCSQRLKRAMVAIRWKDSTSMVGLYLRMPLESNIVAHLANANASSCITTYCKKTMTPQAGQGKCLVRKEHQIQREGSRGLSFEHVWAVRLRRWWSRASGSRIGRRQDPRRICRGVLRAGTKMDCTAGLGQSAEAVKQQSDLTMPDDARCAMARHLSQRNHDCWHRLCSLMQKGMWSKMTQQITSQNEVLGPALLQWMLGVCWTCWMTFGMQQFSNGMGAACVGVPACCSLHKILASPLISSRQSFKHFQAFLSPVWCEFCLFCSIFVLFVSLHCDSVFGFLLRF